MTNLQAFIIAVGIAIGGIGYSMAQQTSPNVLPGCIYNATPPTLSDKQSAPLQCDVNGKLKVTTS